MSWNVEKDVASFFSSLFIASRIFPRVTLSMPLRDVSSSLPQMVDMINEFAPLFGTCPRARRMGNRFHRCLTNAICRMSPLSLSSSMLGAEVDMKSCITNLQLQAGLLAAAAAVRAQFAPDGPDRKNRTSEKIDFKKKSGGIGLVEPKL